MLKRILLFAITGAVSFAGRTQTYAQTQTGEQNPLSLEASYIGDTYYNISGGLGTGGGFMGMANIAVGFDTRKARLWKGGSFRINGASIHGKSLTEHYLGDLQVASNIDAGEHAYLHELWFRQGFDLRGGRSELSFTLGLQDLNAEFMVTEGGGEFINSSFGVPPVIATQLPVPIFPLTGLGVTAQWNITPRWRVQAALFDGDQTPFEENPYNAQWHLGRDDGLLAMGEIHFDGRFKLGGYYHSAEKNYGFYALVDQPVGERVSLFGQLAIAPKRKNDNNYSLGLGVNYYLSERHTFGLAATHAGLHRAERKHETALEACYRFTVNDNLTLQPDFQYIINPSGTEQILKNAFVGMLRLVIAI